MRYSVLGPMEVHDGTTVIKLSPKLRDLLAMLLSRPGVTVPASRLIDSLWEGTPPKSAAKTLQGYIHHLRKALGEDRIVCRRPGYALAVAPGETDAGEFADLARRGRDAIIAGQPERGARLLGDALALWRGTPYDGQDHIPAVADEEIRLTELRHTVAAERADAELALGHHADVAAELRTVVAEDPYRERPRAQLMLALYRMGRAAEALEVCREGRCLLADELGLDPGRQLTELEHDILTNNPRISLPDPVHAASITRRSFGERADASLEAAALRHTPEAQELLGRLLNALGIRSMPALAGAAPAMPPLPGGTICW